MNKFFFFLSRHDTLEHLYEYIISHSVDYFGVSNIEDFTFSINCTDDYFVMIAFPDEFSVATDAIENELLYTDDGYKTIGNHDHSFSNAGQSGLQNNEIRYIKYGKNRTLDEVRKMFYSMSNKILKIKNHKGTLAIEKNEFHYEGEYKKRSFLRKKSTCIDITDEIKKCWN